MMLEGRSLFDCAGATVGWVAAVLLEADVSATGGGGAVGMPVVIPCSWML
jgi:hypothetical protein